MVHVQLREILDASPPGQATETTRSLVVEEPEAIPRRRMEFHLQVAGAQFRVKETGLMQPPHFRAQGAQHLAPRTESGSCRSAGDRHPVQIGCQRLARCGCRDQKRQTADPSAQHHGGGKKAGGAQRQTATVAAIGSIATKHGLEAFMPASGEKDLGERLRGQRGLRHQSRLGTAHPPPAGGLARFQQQLQRLMDRQMIESLGFGGVRFLIGSESCIFYGRVDSHRPRSPWTPAFSGASVLNLSLRIREAAGQREVARAPCCGSIDWNNAAVAGSARQLCMS